MSSNRGNVAVVLGLFDTGLSAVRSLGRVGVDVLAFDSDPTKHGFMSRYCKARVCPDPTEVPDKLADFLMAKGRELDRPGILYPANDAFVLFVSRYRDALARFFLFLMPSSDVIESIMNKRRQYELADRVGTLFPQTLYPETGKDLQRISDRIEYPAFIKPYFSHLWQNDFPSVNKGFKVRTAEELGALFDEIAPLGKPVMVQSVIPGPVSNIFKFAAYIDQEGEPLAKFTMRKIRQYPMEFGIGTLAESIWLPEVAEEGLRFMQAIDYRGIGEVEFKRDERDGRLKLTELNPRLWLQDALASRCGVDFPVVQYLDLTGQKPKPRTTFEEGIKWWHGGMDFKAFCECRSCGKLSFWGWLKSFYDARSFSTFAWDDPLPFLQHYGYGAVFLKAPARLLGLGGGDRGEHRRSRTGRVRHTMKHR